MTTTPPADDPASVVLVKAVQTSMAAPSQWDAWDAQGRYYYLRYRHGAGSIERAESHEVWKHAYATMTWDEEAKRWLGLDAVTAIARFEHGHPLDGHITLEEFAQHAGIGLAPDLQRTAYWRHISDRLDNEFKDDAAALAYADQLLAGIDLDDEQ